jgi:drug/metabolite transporter (DMT)-like permease
LLAAFIFSTMEISGKMIANQIYPFQLTFVRFLIGGLILIPPALLDLRKRNIRLNLNDLLYLTLTGFLCIIVSMTFFQLAIVYTKASTVAAVFSANPVFTIPFAYLILKEKISKKTIISLFISLIGVAFILNPGHQSADARGIFLAITAAITFSLYSVVGKLRIDRYGSTVLNCFSFLIGDIMLFIILLCFKLPIITGINSSNILVILYLGIVVSGIGYLVYFLAMKETSAAASSAVFFIKPALAPVLALIILHENIPYNAAIGILLIIAGSYINFMRKKPR